MTTSDLFNDIKNQIRIGLTKSQIQTGEEDENGHLIYKTVTKDEVTKRILELYDETVYQFQQVNAGANALEKILHRHCPDLEQKELLQEYIALEEEIKQDYTYRFEGDKEFEDEMRRETFRVIKGNKTDK